MKNTKILISLILIIFIALSLTACNKNSTDQNQRKGNNSLYISENNKEDNKELIPVDIIINNNTFSAKLYTNDATKELLNQFPMTINMNEMN